MADDATNGEPEGPRRTGLRDWWLGASALVGVAGLAITQPVLDLFGRNPEFFIAGRYGARQIETFALVVALGPALVAVALATLARLAHPRLGVVVHAVLLALLAFLFGLVLLNSLGVDEPWMALPGAALIAGLVVGLERTRPPMRTLLSYLALGNLAFVTLFLFASPTAELVAADGAAGADEAEAEAGVTDAPRLDGPVVFVILDEFPVTTIMRADGTVNADRYPNLARLAATSTWFRNASSLSSLTSESVPSMLTGQRFETGQLPSYIDHPRSYLTLFGDRYPINLYESVTDMCPPWACTPAERGSVGTAAHDAAVVYGHQVLPGDLADDLDLPGIDHSWGSFGDDLDSPDPDSSSSSDSGSDADSTSGPGPGSGSVADSDPTAGSGSGDDAHSAAGSGSDAGTASGPGSGSGAGADPTAGLGSGDGEGTSSTTDPPAAADGIVGENGYGRWESLPDDERRALGQFTVLERSVARIDARPSVNFVHVALPHYPWSLTPWGAQLTQAPAKLNDMDGPEAREMNAQLRYQLHSLQVGAVDEAVGEMIDHLESVGAWDDALVVVTSDHGTSLLLPDLGRQPTKRNSEERLRMPLFVKAPGQTTGEVRDDVARTIDILPSIVDLLGARTDWPFDGHSLFDGSEPDRPPEVNPSLRPALDIAARHAANYGGDDWDGLAALGIARDQDLVGRPVTGLTVGEPSDLTWSAADEDLLDALPTHDGRVPYLVTGTVTTPDDASPPQILLAVNGIVAGVAATPLDSRDGWQVQGMVAPYFRTGANTLDAYEVEPTPLGPVLHPLPPAD
ncbi:MAG TPA: sulfatase-like hydrolase/transferase [Acidimicrobiales bacterium]|nr:sulfatase-like hydrolase/transferase [Acidimicrobiales bacterium]